MDGRISATAPVTLADQLPLPMIVKSYIRIPGFSFFSFSVAQRTNTRLGDRSFAAA